MYNRKERLHILGNNMEMRVAVCGNCDNENHFIGVITLRGARNYHMIVMGGSKDDAENAVHERAEKFYNYFMNKPTIAKLASPDDESEDITNNSFLSDSMTNSRHDGATITRAVNTGVGRGQVHVGKKWMRDAAGNLSRVHANEVSDLQRQGWRLSGPRSK